MERSKSRIQSAAEASTSPRISTTEAFQEVASRGANISSLLCNMLYCTDNSRKPHQARTQRISNSLEYSNLYTHLIQKTQLKTMSSVHRRPEQYMTESDKREPSNTNSPSHNKHRVLVNNARSEHAWQEEDWVQANDVFTLGRCVVQPICWKLAAWIRLKAWL